MPEQDLADRHFRILQQLREQLARRYMDMPREQVQNPNFSQQPFQFPVIRGDLPIQSDTQLMPGQQWNRLEQNLLGPVPPINGELPLQNLPVRPRQYGGGGVRG